MHSRSGVCPPRSPSAHSPQPVPPFRPCLPPMPTEQSARSRQLPRFPSSLPRRFATLCFLRSPSRARSNPIAGSIGSRDECMVTQELGGQRPTGPEGRPLPRKVRKSERDVIRRSRYPKRLIAVKRKRIFVARLRDGGKGMFQRKYKKRYPIEFLWRLHPSPIQIRAAAQFRRTGETVVFRKFDKNFGRALARAMRTAKG